MRILITGGAGFIASNIADAYVERGHEVHIFDDFSTGQRANVNPKAALHQIDIADNRSADLIEQIKPDILSHHAAQMDGGPPPSSRRVRGRISVYFARLRRLRLAARSACFSRERHGVGSASRSFPRGATSFGLRLRRIAGRSPAVMPLAEEMRQRD